MTTDPYLTSLGTSDRDSIRLLGQDLATDLMGTVNFGDLAYWLVTLHPPTPEQSRLFNAVLVALADHGFTPLALATRLTLHSAPESVQGAMAAGLLGGGSRLLGVIEEAAIFLDDGVSDAGNDPDFDAIASELLRAQVSKKRAVPGLGHPLHKDGDPRTPVLYSLAEEVGLVGPHLRLLTAIGRTHPEILGRTLPLNGAGVCGAILVDLGIPPSLVRGVALVARSAGLLGHIAEEMRHPIAGRLYHSVESNAEYVAPGAETRNRI